MFRLQARLLAHAHLAADLRGLAGARRLADGAARMEARHPASHRGQPGGRADARSTSCCAAIRCATSTAASRWPARFLHDKEFYLAARSLKNKVGLQVVTPLRTDDGTHRAVRPRLGPAEQKDPAKRAAGPGRGPRRAHRHRAAQPGAAPVRARERARHERLVPCRRAADAQHGRRQARSRSSTPSSSRPTPRPIPAACRSAARRGSTSPTTICSTPSPGS